MQVTILIPIFHRGVGYGVKIPVRYRFQWRKTTVCWLQRATWKKRYRALLKSIALLQNCKLKSKRIVDVLKCKKMFLLEKIDKNVHFNHLFLGNSSNFYLRPRKAGGFFIWGLKKVDRLKQCPLYGFICFRDAWKGRILKPVMCNDDLSMYWCEILLTKNDVTDQIKITDRNWTHVMTHVTHVMTLKYDIIDTCLIYEHINKYPFPWHVPFFNLK